MTLLYVSISFIHFILRLTKPVCHPTNCQTQEGLPLSAHDGSQLQSQTKLTIDWDHGTLWSFRHNCRASCDLASKEHLFLSLQRGMRAPLVYFARLVWVVAKTFDTNLKYNFSPDTIWNHQPAMLHMCILMVYRMSNPWWVASTQASRQARKQANNQADRQAHAMDLWCEHYAHKHTTRHVMHFMINCWKTYINKL